MYEKHSMDNQELLNKINKTDQSKIVFYEKKKFSLSCENQSINLAIYTSLKHKFKDKYKYPIAIFAGINILLVMVSRDCAPMFFELQMYIQNQGNNQILAQVYYVCNCFFPLFVGYITDYIGYNMGLIALYVPTLLGSLLTLASVMGDKFSVETAVVGRILFAVGGESLQVILLTVVINYFRKSKVMCHGIITTISVVYLGYAVFKLLLFSQIFKIDNVSPSNETPMVGPAVFGLIFNGVSFLFSILLVIFENSWQKMIKMESSLLDFPSRNDSFLNERQIYPFSFWQSLKNVLTFPILITSFMQAIIAGSFYSIVSYNRYFFQLDPEISEINMIGQSCFSSVIYFFMAMTGFFMVGKYLDKNNQKNFLMILGCLLNSFSYLLFTNFYLNFQAQMNLLFTIYYLGTISLGVGMGLFSSAIYASIPMLINSKNITICLGLLFSITNMVLLCFVCLAPTMTTRESFFMGKNPFWMFCLFGILLAVALELYERRNKKKSDEFGTIQDMKLFYVHKK